MRWGQLLLCGWPGLSRLWLRGHGPSLLIAVGFSILLNLALVSTFLWPALLGEAFPALAWPVIGLVWLGSFLISVKMTPIWSEARPMAAVAERDQFATNYQNTKESEKDEQTSDLSDLEPADFEQVNHEKTAVENSVTADSRTLFNQAQTEYLKGHWNEALTLLTRQIETDHRDMEARLLLATMSRRVGELDNAGQQLKQMQRFDEAVHWKFEIGREIELLDREREEIESERQLNKSVNTNDDDVAADTTKLNSHELQQDLEEVHEQQPDETDIAGDLVDTTETTKSWLC